MMLSRSCGLLGSTSMLVALASGIEEDQGLTSKHLQSTQTKRRMIILVD